MNKVLKSVLQGNRTVEPHPSSSAEGHAETAAIPESPAAAANTIMVLGKTLFFKGELSADEDLFLLGRVEGTITHTENLTIGIDGVVKGNMSARTITIKGTVEGDITASESVVVAPSAVVKGDIVALRVSISDGAKFNGSVTMPSQAASDGADDRLSKSSRLNGEYVISGRDIERLLNRR